METGVRVDEGKREPMIRKVSVILEKLAAERPVFLSFLVFLTAAFLVVTLSLPVYFRHTQEILLNVLAEAHGTVFDLLIIGWFLFWINKLAERRLRSNRYREEIDDFLGWQSHEATHRIVGNIRRLNRIDIKEKFRLTEAYLKGANLGNAVLKSSDLWGANLSGANLRESNLSGANLAGAMLNGADMERAVVENADLRGASMHETGLERSNLSGSDLRGVDLKVADLQYAVLANCNLERANFEGANLRGARLDGSNLNGTLMQEANLSTASLRNTDLRNVRIDHSDFTDADLRGARFPDEEAKLLTLFEKVKSLQRARFDPKVDHLLAHHFAHLFTGLLAEGQGALEPVSDPAEVNERPPVRHETNGVQAFRHPDRTK